MKILLMAIAMAFSAIAFASDKNQSCDAYMQSALNNAKPEVRLELGLKAMAIAAEATLTPAQESKILANSKNFIATNPSKQNDFEKMFYFACTTDLDADEKEQLKDQLLALENLASHLP